MAYRSFRKFLDALDEAGELKRVAVPVDTDLLIAEWADREIKSSGGGKAVFFEQPIIDGRKSEFPVAINTMGSRRRMALALQVADIGDIAPGNSTHPESKTADRSARRLEFAQTRDSSAARAAETGNGRRLPGGRA